MKKVKSFLRIFQQSFFPSVVYYKKLSRVNFKISLLYFIFLVLILNITLITSLILKNSPKKINNLLSSVTKVLEEFPNDYTIQIKQGSLITSYDKPKFFWLDYLDKKIPLLVIDKNLLLKQAKLYLSLSLLTSEGVMINPKFLCPKIGLIRIPLSYFNNLTFNKQTALLGYSFINSLKQSFIFFYIVSVFLIFLLITFSSLIVLTIYLLLSTLLVFLIFKFFLRRRFYLKKTFQIGFHAITFPLVLNYFLMVLPKINFPFTFDIPLTIFPLAYFLVILIFIFAGNYFAHLSNHDKI